MTEKVEKTFWFCDLFISKRQWIYCWYEWVYQGMKSPKLGMTPLKGYHLLKEGIRKGYLFYQKWYIKG